MAKPAWKPGFLYLFRKRPKPMALPDQDRIRFSGSGSAVQGNTAYGFYDRDPMFLADCYASMMWGAYRLGYPMVDIELVDKSFYIAFEDAVNVYSAKVNEFNIVNNMFALQGQPVNTGSNFTGRAVLGTGLPFIINLARDYGTEAGTGGKVDYKKASIDVTALTQDYDLQALLGDVLENGRRIEIRRVFHERAPASARIYDPFSMTGMSYSNILNEMGFGAYSPAVQFLMTPIFEDLLRTQAIEFNDMVRKSAYSFELKNNKLRLFPVPQSDFKVWIEYLVDEERFVSGSLSPEGQDVVSDFADVPYKHHTYSEINDPGRNWIRNYFLANCKEMLGLVRQKYVNVPLGDGEITLDGAELRAEAQQEKEKLVTQLQEMLEAAGKFNQMSKAAEMAEQMQETLKKTATFIYVG
jgi:hypothetical protein